jgi:hypothetical protein
LLEIDHKEGTRDVIEDLFDNGIPNNLLTKIIYSFIVMST